MRPRTPSFRDTLRRLIWPVTVMVLILLVFWRPAVPIASMEQGAQLSADDGAAMSQASGPPWHYGSTLARYTLILYADLECPYCRTYVPPLMAWIEQHPDIRLQWQHLPLSMHEPAASQLAVLAECAGEAGGPEAYWRTISWIYQHTQGEGLGLPDGIYPPDYDALRACLESERPLAIVRAQADGAADHGIAATPTLQLRDERTGQSLWFQGPIPGDALLSAMDLLVTDDPTSELAETTELSAVPDGNKPR
ncbi:DsbA family protein [Paenalcaligenes niemegkensis]|uniref:DsbA family protein n=1 Tax=Paenalcaligenes niemegkensis TaxID=2895469 RepID=UPI001EE8D091|nr:thioredoxin domain-containing protein [Paenalcaligenes niemegkensis]MCQ9617371.1 DsbA family protein [Paenalcaligenes niemegkensis]